MQIPAWLYRSNPVSVFTLNPGGSQQVFRNGRPDAVFVCTFMQLINTSSSSGDAILIQDELSQVAVHSGFVGTASFDRFPLSCSITVQPGARLIAFAVTGRWSVTVSGYYTPHLLDQ